MAIPLASVRSSCAENSARTIERMSGENCRLGVLRAGIGQERVRAGGIYRQGLAGVYSGVIREGWVRSSRASSFFSVLSRKS